MGVNEGGVKGCQQASAEYVTTQVGHRTDGKGPRIDVLRVGVVRAHPGKKKGP